MTKAFELVTDFTPQGDQPQAIAELTANMLAGVRRTPASMLAVSSAMA